MPVSLVLCAKLWHNRDMNAQQPVRTEAQLVDGDLCDIVANRRYCQQDGAVVATDADGRTRILCSDHAARYLPVLEMAA